MELYMCDVVCMHYHYTAPTYGFLLIHTIIWLHMLSSLSLSHTHSLWSLLRTLHLRPTMSSRSLLLAIRTLGSRPSCCASAPMLSLPATPAQSVSRFPLSRNVCGRLSTFVQVAAQTGPWYTNYWNFFNGSLLNFKVRDITCGHSK